MISYKNFCDLNYGRIGNQIFQYSICKILSHMNNCDFYLNPNHCFLTMFDTKSLSYCELLKDLNLKNYIEKETFQFDTHLLHTNNINLSGFFQNINYYDSFIKIIKQELRPNSKLLRNTKEYIQFKIGLKANINDIACLHVRRCDYTNINFYRHLTISNYYKTALNQINSKYVFVISDDINLVEEEFKALNNNDQKIIFVKELDMFHDFYIMYLSPISIIANSTFSFWSSLLSDKDQVFSPRYWFNTKNQMINNAFKTKQSNWNFINNQEWQSLF